MSPPHIPYVYGPLIKHSKPISCGRSSPSLEREQHPIGSRARSAVESILKLSEVRTTLTSALLHFEFCTDYRRGTLTKKSAALLRAKGCCCLVRQLSLCPFSHLVDGADPLRLSFRKSLANLHDSVLGTLVQLGFLAPQPVQDVQGVGPGPASSFVQNQVFSSATPIIGTSGSPVAVRFAGRAIRVCR